MHKDRIVVHTTLGYKNAPFSISDKFGDYKTLKYKPNLNLIHGVGIAYKWFSININYKLPKSLRDGALYGETKYFDVGLQFNFKRWHFRAGFHNYVGFGIKNATLISDTLPITNKGFHIDPELNTSSISLSAFYFFDKTVDIQAATGRVGRYVGSAHGFYLRSMMNLYQVKSPHGIIPFKYMEDPDSRQMSNTLGAFEIGAVPGYSYLNNLNGWQFSFFAGLGGVLQAKYYAYSKTRSFLGLAPRVDLMIQGGYNVENWFVMLTSSFNQNNIRFNDFRYNQFYYNIGVTYGYRFHSKKSRNGE